MSSRYRLCSVLAALALALGPACTSTEGSGRLARGAPRVGWTNSDVHWISQPRSVGGRFVAYLERDGWLSVAAVDATTGEMAWEVPASVSGLTSGVSLHLASDDRLVYFGTPVDPGRVGASVFVIAIEAASGAEIWRTTTSLILADSLYECDDDKAAFCVADEAPGPDRALRIAKADGKVTSRSASTAPPPIGRALGSGLYDLGTRDPEVIAAIDPSGNTRWTKTAFELFPGRLVSSDYGWQWDRYGDLLVGSLGWVPLDPGQWDLSQSSIAGVNAATGEVVWIDDGAELGCGYTLATVVVRGEPLRCRMTGTTTNDPDDPDDETIVAGLTVVMERFDPATGATVWQADLGPALALVLDRAPLVRLSRTEFALGREDGSSVAVDIVTGHTRTPAPEDIGWCFSDNIVRDRRTLRDPVRRRGESYVAQSRPDGTTVDGLVSSPIERGAWLGETFAWVDARGMHASTTGWVRW